ncbi:hypothetical protein K438DRAFT_2145026 [Mycena galopus ATCC 62051]|nr:hypothetical protein K438DRAFT_2145026 [Mycena galopus ATCC 62051]
MSLTKRIRPFIGRNYLELRHLTFLVDYLAPDAVTLRACLYFIGTLIYYSVTVCLIINCVSGSVQDDALDHCYVPGASIRDAEGRSMARGFSLLTNAGHDWMGLDLPFRATTTIVRSVKAGSIVSGLEVIERNLQHYPNFQRFKSCLGDNSQITGTMPGFGGPDPWNQGVRRLKLEWRFIYHEECLRIVTIKDAMRGRGKNKFISIETLASGSSEKYWQVNGVKRDWMEWSTRDTCQAMSKCETNRVEDGWDGVRGGRHASRLTLLPPTYPPRPFVLIQVKWLKRGGYLSETAWHKLAIQTPTFWYSARTRHFRLLDRNARSCAEVEVVGTSWSDSEGWKVGRDGEAKNSLKTDVRRAKQLSISPGFEHNLSIEQERRWVFDGAESRRLRGYDMPRRGDSQGFVDHAEKSGNRGEVKGILSREAAPALGVSGDNAGCGRISESRMSEQGKGESLGEGSAGYLRVKR